jgi:putative DNA primase/helicase
LVIIDPITAYLGDADSHKNAEVRALLAPLAEMAASQRVSVLAVSHLTKSAGMDALLRVQGSIGFAAAARAVWGVAKDKDNPSRRLFMPLNAAPHQFSITASRCSKPLI